MESIGSDKGRKNLPWRNMTMTKSNLFIKKISNRIKNHITLLVLGYIQ